MEKQVEQKPRMRYSDEELSLIKQAFKANEDILLSLRKWFLQMPLETLDQVNLKRITDSKETLAIIRKTFLPELDPNAPLSQLADMWVGVEIKDKLPETAYPHILSREKVTQYLEQQLLLLEGTPGEPAIMFVDMVKGEDKDILERYVDLLTRNTIITHCQFQLMQLNVLANNPEITPVNAKEAKRKDSLK